MQVYFYTYPLVLKSLRSYLYLWFQSTTAGFMLTFFLFLPIAPFSENEKSGCHYPYYILLCSILFYIQYSFRFASPYPCIKQFTGSNTVFVYLNVLFEHNHNTLIRPERKKKNLSKSSTSKCSYFPIFLIIFLTVF